MGVIPPLRCRGNRTPLILSLSKDKGEEVKKEIPSPLTGEGLGGGDSPLRCRGNRTPLILSLSKDKGEGTFSGVPQASP